MSIDALSLKYYINPDGSKNEFVYALNCLEAPIYFCLRALYGIQRPITELFIKDYCLTIQHKNGRILSINTKKLDSTISWEYNVTLDEITPQEGYEISALKELLTQKNLVMIQTVNAMLPFDSRYGEIDETDLINFVPRHTNLFIGFSNNDFYYVENRMGICMKNFIPYPKNAEVGIINRPALEPALHVYSKYLTVSALNPSYLPSEEEIKKIIQQITKNYLRKSCLLPDGSILSCGHTALEFFYENFENGTVKLNDKISLNGRSEEYLRIFIMYIDDIKKAVIILNHCVLEYTWINAVYKTLVLVTGSKLTAHITMLTNNLLKQYYRKTYVYGPNHVKSMNEIIKLFDNYNALLISSIET